jgi:hypothetical protein
MASRVKYPRQNRYKLNCLQKLRVEQAYPCFSCKAYPDRLECVGRINPDPEDEEGSNYKIKIVYRRIPKVWVISPKIESDRDIHMYRDESLCLYYPEDFRWRDKSNLHETILPWTAEWLVFYEKHLRSGTWEGPEAPHSVAD